MAEDPTPLRFRTYLWFPVLTVGTVLLLTLQAATRPDSVVLRQLLLFSLSGLYVSAFIGIRGLLRDATALAEAGVDWQPSWRRYVLTVVVIASGLTLVTVFPPVSLTEDHPLGPAGLVGAAIVSFALATGPVCTTYLLVRWWRIGLNYL